MLPPKNACVLLALTVVLVVVIQTISPVYSSEASSIIEIIYIQPFYLNNTYGIIILKICVNHSIDISINKSSINTQQIDISIRYTVTQISSSDNTSYYILNILPVVLSAKEYIAPCMPIFLDIIIKGKETKIEYLKNTPILVCSLQPYEQIYRLINKNMQIINYSLKDLTLLQSIDKNIKSLSNSVDEVSKNMKEFSSSSFKKIDYIIDRYEIFLLLITISLVLSIISLATSMLIMVNITKLRKIFKEYEVFGL